MSKKVSDAEEVIRAYGRNCSIPATYDEDGVQVSSAHDGLGRELPDSVPLEPPAGFSSGPSLADFIKRTIQNEISRRAAEEGFESFEEAEDFDIEDDPQDPHTLYEAVFDPPLKGEKEHSDSLKSAEAGDKAPAKEPTPEPPKPE